MSWPFQKLTRMSVLLPSLWLAACATEPGVFKLNPADSAEAQSELVWPRKDQEDVPRYLYLGELTGEANFGKKEDGAKGFIRWIADLIQGEAKPVILQRPQSGVVDDSGRVLVTDSSRQAVYVFDQQQGRLDVWSNAVGLSRFSSPTGIALGEEGSAFVADSNLGFVVKLDRNGKNIGVIGRGVLKRPVGVVYDSLQSLLYVADTYAHDIKVFDEQGHLQRTLGHRGDGGGEFNFPTYMTLHQGELYVVDTMNAQVQVLDLVSGEVTRVISKRGLNLGNLVRPKGVAVDSEGNTYVVESYYDHLLVYNREGQFLLPIGGNGRAPGQFYLPSGVWVDAANRVYVADMFNGRVSVFQFLGGGLENE